MPDGFQLIEVWLLRVQLRGKELFDLPLHTSHVGRRLVLIGVQLRGKELFELPLHTYQVYSPVEDNAYCLLTHCNHGKLPVTCMF